MFVNQLLTGVTAKNYKKSVPSVWWVCGKALPLHPQSRERRGKLEMVKTEMRLEAHLKNFLKKNFGKVWWFQK